MFIGIGMPLTQQQTQTPFNPASISGLALWLDSADTSSITQSGGSVSQINDKSGNSRHATQATSSLQPITASRTVNSKNALSFDGIDDTLTAGPAFSHTQPMTRVCVIKLDSYNAVGQTAMVDGGGQLLRETGGAFKIFAGIEIGTAARNTNTNIHTAIYNSSNSFHYINGVLNVNGNAFTQGSSGTVALMQRNGGTGNAAGLFCELLEYTGVLSNANLNLLGNYLASKWGLTWSTI